MIKFDTLATPFQPIFEPISLMVIPGYMSRVSGSLIGTTNTWTPYFHYNCAKTQVSVPNIALLPIQYLYEDSVGELIMNLFLS